MLEIVDRLVNMRPRKGGSLHDVHVEAAHRIERLHKAVKDLQMAALDYAEGGTPLGDAVEEAQRALVELGDPDACKADREYESWKKILGLS